MGQHDILAMDAVNQTNLQGARNDRFLAEYQLNFVCCMV